MRVLSLFSGGGLGDYGLELAGMEIVGQVEIDDYCQKILKLRWPHTAKYRDIREFDGSKFVREHGPVDLISGGFPCQPFSSASRGRVRQKSMWDEFVRVCTEVMPKYVLAENVPGAPINGFIMPASKLGAPHIRKRLWLFCDTDNEGKPNRKLNDEASWMPKDKSGFWEDNRPDLRVDDGGSFRMERFKLLGNGQVVQVVQWIGKRIMEFDSKTKGDV